MKYLHKICAVFISLAIVLVVVSCSSPKQKAGESSQSTTSATSDETSRTIDNVTTTSVSDRVVDEEATQKITPTTTKTNVAAPTTSTRNINVLPTKITAPSEVTPDVPDIVFPKESTDYDALRKVILQKFPNEEKRTLDQFKVFVADRNIELTGAVYCVLFKRYINGCSTESSYDFSFNEKGACVELRGRCVKYDSTKVVPPRVATEVEIEEAMKAEAEKIQDQGFEVWKQEYVGSVYNISMDANYFVIRTTYVAKGSAERYADYKDVNSPNYGKTPPCSLASGNYVITR